MKKLNLSAATGAFLAAFLVALELGAMLFGIAFVSLAGIALIAGYVIAFLVTLLCFFTLCRSAYKGELKLVEKPGESNSENR